MSNIKNNNYRKIDCRLLNDEYMDFMLSKDGIKECIPILNNCLGAKLDFFNHTNKYVVSNIAWNQAVTSAKILENIGYTSVDNGFITYERDRIGNDEFLDLYTNSTFDLSTYGDKFFVSEVRGNSGTLVYPIEVKDDYTALKGGFYQGFFKVDGDKYQTLPHRINDEWNFNITLQRQNYTTLSNILNNVHPENDGLFFFIGARAENKFWELYKIDPEINHYKYDDSDDYSLDYSISDSEVIKHQYVENNLNSEANEECDINGPFADDYLQEQLSLQDIKLTDSKGNALNETGFYEIETDNKFIFFNNTKDGYNKNTWQDSYKFILTGKKDYPNINYFPYLHNGKDGYNKDNINNLIQEHQYAYDVFTEMKNNAIGFKINENGSISYRYLIGKDEIIEETSQPNLVNYNEWCNIHIKLVRKASQQENECANSSIDGKMQIYIYVNGQLKLISKELPELKLRALNDSPERQEGVPYNISIGGGTQGLNERILLDYYDKTDYILPLEKHFGGTFIGNIKNFTFIPCAMDFPVIYQNRHGF